MKKIVIIVALSAGLFAEGNNSVFDMPPPGLKSQSHILSTSFELYKDTVCGLSMWDTLKPRCVELSVKRAFGVDVAKDVKYYNDENGAKYLASLKK